MYLIALMKCPSFDPDSVLRTKLVCDSHKNSSKQKTYKSVWAWIYGIDEDTLIKLLDEEISHKTSLKSRKESGSRKLNTAISSNLSTKKFKKF